MLLSSQVVTALIVAKCEGNVFVYFTIYIINVAYNIVSFGQPFLKM